VRRPIAEHDALASPDRHIVESIKADAVLSVRLEKVRIDARTSQILENFMLLYTLTRRYFGLELQTISIPYFQKVNAS